MIRTSLAVLTLLALATATLAAQDNKDVTRATNDEIGLAVSQAERALILYKTAIELEKELPSSKKEPAGVQKDREVAEGLAQVIAGLKTKPESFHGFGGFLLLSLLDDAARNSLLCSNSALGDSFTNVTNGMAKDGKFSTSKAFELLHIQQACFDASNQFYTVSENVHALVVRDLEFKERQDERIAKTLASCRDYISKNPPK